MKRSVGELAALLHLLDEALDLPEDRRQGWLDALPEIHAHLKPALQRLLTAPANEAEIADAARDNMLAMVQSDLHSGARVGPYELDRELGQGGMGSVWLAHRADGAYQRAVALKLPHGLWMGNLAARMVRERDILASLQHENIAGFFDAGVDHAGRPFIAMEYVKGQPIDVYCHERGLSVRERLLLILGVAKAVAHAHSKLVVHRDLKPNNILVTADGAVRLLDFGVATLLDRDGEAQRTRLTQFAGRALTIDYASPEQIRGESVDTTSDVYSLAVVTFELLTGTRPYRLKRGTAAELAQVIAEIDPRPASECAGDPAVKRQLQGDLDAVLNKAMKKSRAERYATVAAFGDEIERYIDRLPVLARPDSVPYRFRKFVVRNAVQVGAAVVVLLALLVGSGVALWQAHTARTEAARAQVTKDFLVDIFRSNDVRIAADKPHAERTVREVLEQASTRIEKQFAGDPQTQMELLLLTATIFENQGDMERFEQLQQRRTELAKEYYGPTHWEVIEQQLIAADAAVAHNEHERASKLLAECNDLLRKSDHDGGAQRADWWRINARLMMHTVNDDNAPLALIEKANAIYRKVAPTSREYSVSLDMQAILLVRLGKLSEALPIRREAIRVLQNAPVKDEMMLSAYTYNLARLQQAAGQLQAADETYARAEDLALRTAGVTGRNYMRSVAGHASMLHRQGDVKRAQELFARLLPAFSPLGTNDNEILAREEYAVCLTAEGRALEAIPILEAVEKRYQVKAPSADARREARLELADAYDRVGRETDARAMLSELYEQSLAHPDAKAQWMHRVRERWARFLIDRARASSDDLAKAEAALGDVTAESPDVIRAADALAHSDLARIALARNDSKRALHESQLALTMLAHAQPDDDVRLSHQVWLVHSAVLLQNGDAKGAKEWATKAL